MKLCRCGHTDQRGKHPDGWDCGAYNCPCTSFADVWDSKPLQPGVTMHTPEVAPHPAVRTYDGELWIGLTSHTARLAAGE